VPGERSPRNMAHRNGKQDPPAYLPVADAARALGYTPQHVRRLLRERKLAGMRIGFVWAISSRAVDSFRTRHAGQRGRRKESSR
jgi:hypothetical protein